MKKVIYALFLLLSISVEAKEYVACGETEEIAKKRLVESIYVSVSTTFEKNETLSRNEDEVQASSEIVNSSRQSSDLELVDLENFQKGSNTCYKTSSEKLEKTLLSLKSEVFAFRVRNLPKERAVAKEETKKVIHKCEVAKNLAFVLGKRNLIAKLSKKLQSLKKFAETLQLQSVKFELPHHSLKIFIDGKKRKYKINEEIYLPVGKHFYLIKSKRFCDISGEFELKADEKVVIDDIDFDSFQFPIITWTTNQESKNLTLEVNGKRKRVNKEYQFKKCQGELTYQAKYDDGKFSDIKTGKVTLSAGLNKDIFLDFLSFADIKRIQSETQPYKKGQRVEFLYSYGFVEKDREFWHDTHNIEINLLTHKRFFRYGYGFLFGANKKVPTVKSFELYYQLAVQFSSFGEYDLPLRIGNISFLPYGGVELGFGYHEYKYKDIKIYQYPEEGDDDAENSPDDYDNFNWKRDFLVVKPILGVDIILSKGFAFKIFAEKEIFIDKRWYIGTGLSIEF